ncbi:hypothetical protein HDU76_001816 [Blyttiomyces sp. JEL0837]|nr:hypothetical protein HDU76_001816 [Blyttiomyces sp. JEL0837]
MTNRNGLLQTMQAAHHAIRGRTATLNLDPLTLNVGTSSIMIKLMSTVTASSKELHGLVDKPSWWHLHSSLLGRTRTTKSCLKLGHRRTNHSNVGIGIESRNENRIRLAFSGPTADLSKKASAILKTKVDSFSSRCFVSTANTSSSKSPGLLLALPNVASRQFHTTTMVAMARPHAHSHQHHPSPHHTPSPSPNAASNTANPTPLAATTTSPPTRRSWHHRRHRPNPRKTFRRLRILVTFVTLAAAGGASLVMMQSHDWMNPIEALGVAAAGLVRLVVSLTAGIAIGVMYQVLFSKYTNYDSEEYKEARSKVHKRAAEWLLWLARMQGGIYVKAAQHIASLAYIAPVEFTSTLSVLQDQAPSRPWSVMSKVLKSELGITNVLEVFKEFDEKPIAAASLAQVHKAKTLDGELVAVKIQKPDLAHLLEVDTATMQLLSDLAALSFKDFSFTWVITEFKTTLRAEFDFKNEARNCELTNERFRHRRAAVRCPKVRWDLTTKKVLVMEFVDGVKVNDEIAIKGLGLVPTDVGRLACEVFAEMIFQHGVIHCDPHAGNMMVVRSPIDPRKPQLVILDHGLYRTLDDRFRLLYCHLWKAMVTGDMALLRDVSEALGVGKYASHFPVIFTGRTIGSRTPLGSEMTKADRKKVRESLGDVTFANLMDFLESLPRDMLFAQRVSNMIRGLHRQLGGANAERLMIHAIYAVKGSWCKGILEREAEVLTRVEVKEAVASRLKGPRVGPPAAGILEPDIALPKAVVKAERRVEGVWNGYIGMSIWRPWQGLFDDVDGFGRKFMFFKDYLVVLVRFWAAGQAIWLSKVWQRWVEGVVVADEVVVALPNGKTTA